LRNFDAIERHGARRSLPWRSGNNPQSLRAMLGGPESEKQCEGGELTKKRFPDFRSIC
jgi:hypothetical protein